MRNLVGDPAAAEMQKELDGKLSDWMKREGDGWALDWTAQVEDAGRLYTYRTFHTVAEYLEWAEKHPNLAP